MVDDGGKEVGREEREGQRERREGEGEERREMYT